MRIKQVELKNIGPHRQLSVELGRGLIGLTGSNGAGKSTLVNAIYAALTNDFSRFSNVKSDIITNGSGKESSYIRLTGEHRNQSFELTRWLRPNKTEFTIGGVSYAKANEVNEAIAAQLNISKLVIDKYVYDPNRKTGEMALSTTKGVFRFVGGSISKNSEVVVTTPSATIGIRGGIATIEVADGGATRATFLYGDSLRVTNQGVTQTATRNGSQITASAGEKPTPPAILPPGRMPATQPFEKTASPAPAGTAPRNVIANVLPQVQQQAVQQQLLQQQAIQQQPATAPATLATTPLATQITPVTTTAPIQPTLASIDTALDQSGLTRNNSRVPPGRMHVASRFDPKGPGQRGSGPEGQSTPPPRRPTKAGPPGGPSQGPPKPPAIVRAGPGPAPKPVIPPPRFVQNQPQTPKKK